MTDYSLADDDYCLGLRSWEALPNLLFQHVNLVLDSVRSIGYKRPFSKIASFDVSARPAWAVGNAEIQWAVAAMVKHIGTGFGVDIRAAKKNRHPREWLPLSVIPAKAGIRRGRRKVGFPPSRE
jgi:hypothetical protein